MKKRLLLLLIAVALVITSVPTIAFADGEDLPTATVEQLTPLSGTDLYVTEKTTEWTENRIGAVNLGVMYKFAANDTPENINESPYKKWFCDYVVTFDKDVPKYSMGLYGSYTGYNNIAFLNPFDVPANQEIFLLRELGLDSQLTYFEVVSFINEFYCGAFNLWEGNYDTTMSVTLTLFQKDEEGNPINRKEINNYTYKLTDYTKVSTDYGNFRYGGVGTHEEGYLLIDNLFVPQTYPETYFLLDHEGEEFVVALTSQTTAGGATVANVTGGGTLVYGDTAVASTNAIAGYAFKGWFRDSYSGTPVSTDYTYTFTVKEDVNLVAVYEPQAGTNLTLEVNGAAYTVKAGSASAKNQTGYIIKKYPAGTPIELNYTADDGFMYWVNSSDNIVSKEELYDFTLVIDTEIRAITHGNTGDNESATVTFLNPYMQVLSSSRWYDDEVIDFPSVNPSKMGYTFNHWEIEETGDVATDATIHAAMYGNDALHIIPIYDKIDETYKVTVQIYDAAADSLTVVTPDETFLNDYPQFVEIAGNAVEAKTGVALTFRPSQLAVWAGLDKDEVKSSFSYWSVGDYKTQKDSLDKAQHTVVSAIDGTEITLTLVLNSNDDLDQPILDITQMFATQMSDGTYKLSTTMKYYVPDKFTLHETGFVYGTKAAVFGAEGGADKLVIDGEYVKRHITGRTESELIYTFNATAPKPTNTLYVRAYMIYTDAANNIITIYTDMFSGCYNNLPH